MTKKIEDMTPEELTEYEVELNRKLKLREMAEKQKQIAEAEAAEAKEAKDAKDAAKAQLKIEIAEELFIERPELRPVEKIPTEDGETKGDEDNAMVNFYNAYRKKHTTFETGSKYEHESSLADNERFQIYRDQRWQETGTDSLFLNTDSDDGCGDEVGDWSPDDVYAKVIWETFVCTADLLRICVKGISINPGDGLGVQIRAFGAFQSPVARNACQCASCASITFSTYSLTLVQYNLEAVICDKDIFDVGNILMDAYLIAMANSWAAFFDAQIYAALIAAAASGATETLPAAVNCTPLISGSCCTDAALVNIYNAVHAAVAAMREGTSPYNPDYLILSPTIAAIFKRMQSPTPMPWMGDVSFDGSGRLKSMGGLKVIEYCGANSCATTSGMKVAVIVDSRRAVGAVFGQRPKLYKFFQSNCNSYRLDQWAYMAFGTLDLNAIAHIVNP